MRGVWSHRGSGQEFPEARTQAGGFPAAGLSPPTHLSKCFCPSQEVFSCNCLKDPDSAHSPTALLVLLMRTRSSQATKGVAVCDPGMLNMGGRGACDPTNSKTFFPATSGSSCVQVLRPLPTSLLSFCEGDCSSLPGLPGQPRRRGVSK